MGVLGILSILFGVESFHFAFPFFDDDLDDLIILRLLLGGSHALGIELHGEKLLLLLLSNRLLLDTDWAKLDYPFQIFCRKPRELFSGLFFKLRTSLHGVCVDLKVFKFGQATALNRLESADFVVLKVQLLQAVQGGLDREGVDLIVPQVQLTQAR